MPSASCWRSPVSGTTVRTASLNTTTAAWSPAPSDCTNEAAAAFACGIRSPAMLPETSITTMTLSGCCSSIAACTDSTGSASWPSNAWNCAAVSPCTGTPRPSSTVTTTRTEGYALASTWLTVRVGAPGCWARAAPCPSDSASRAATAKPATAGRAIRNRLAACWKTFTAA